MERVTAGRERLATPVLVSRLLALLDFAARHTRRLPADALRGRPPGSDLTRLDLAYHVPQVVVGFLDAALGGRLTPEHFERRTPQHFESAGQVAGLTQSVAQALAVWWGANQSRLPSELDTFDGPQSLPVLLERTVVHVGHHVRQLEAMLDSLGIEPEPRLPDMLLAGLAIPDDVGGPQAPRS
jgi:uncharacterized damage-inducible protein DinB